MSHRLTHRLPLLLLPALLAACLLLGSCAASGPAATHDINEVNGCPEFLELTWEMTKAKIEPLAEWDAAEEDYLILQQFSLPHGLPQVDVLLQFTGINHTLDSVMFFFPKSASGDFAAVAEIYYQLYGPASSGTEEAQQLGWLGQSTNIYLIKENENITVSYLRAVADIPLSQMDAADFLDYIDPYALLGEPALLGYNIKELISGSGYTEGVDYQLTTYPADGSPGAQNIYTFLPNLSYLGTEQTYLEIYTPADADTIEYFTYGFVYEESAVNTLIDQLQEAMPHFEELFGATQACVFTPVESATSQELSWDALCTTLASLQQGVYSLLWIQGELTVTLNITVNAQYQGVIDGTLGFASVDYWQ